MNGGGDSYFSASERIAESLDKKVNKIYHKRSLTRVFIEIAVAVVIMYILFGIIFGIVIIKGDSMEPSIANSSPCIYYRIEKTYKKGDVILFRDENGDPFVRRVLATAGDIVNIEEGKLTVNGENEIGYYMIGDTEQYEGGIDFPLTVPSSSLFVLGDNREGSVDSRVFGCINKYTIEGRVLLEFQLFGR